MNVLVTGGCGFIGLHVIKKLVDEGYEPIAYDITIPQAELIKDFYGLKVDKVKFIKGDITEVLKVLEVIKKYDIKNVVHMATLLTVASEENPYKAFKVNVDATVNLLEISRITDVERFVFISSEAVYGITDEEPIDEDYPKRPISMYGITKLASELIALKYAELYGLETVVLRYPMVYGPGLAVGGTRTINDIIESAVKTKFVKVDFKSDCRVEPLYVKDAANSVYLALKAEKPQSKVYNIGVGTMYTLKEIFEVVKRFAPEAQAVFGDKSLTLAYPARGPLKIERAYRELGYIPQYDLINGVKDYVTMLKHS